MAKRNKAKFASKSRKSGLRIEALEQRQLLAAVVGGGTEVGSNIVHPNGNVYDQVLMTGSSVTVSNDAGQVTRISFLDKTGDITQAEFSGAGTLTVSLADFAAAAPAAEYNQPGVNYVSGNATFTIQNSDANTNFSVFSVGPGNAINQSLFSGGKDGGNNVADVQAIVIVNNPQNPGGFTNFGGIRAGNAVFSGSSGNVGITAAGVSVQGPVIIGDINASDVGVPVLNFGAASQFNTLVVAGGDLVQTNNQLILGGVGAGIQSVNFTAGATSLVESRPGFTAGSPDLGAQVNTSGNIFTSGTEPTLATLDAITTIDLTGKTQAQIDALFAGRTFTNNITVTGDLAITNSITAQEFRGNVTFTGALTGNVTVVGDIDGTLTLAKSNVSNTITAATIGGITASENLTGTVMAKSIGNVAVTGDLTGVVSTDYYSVGGVVAADPDGAGPLTVTTAGFDMNEKGIGNVNVTGNLSGTVYGVLGIGNVTVGKDVTTTTTALRTSSGTTGDAFLGNIGKVTVEGDVSQAGGALINIAANGTFGDVNIKGAGTVTASHTVGTITVGGVLGGGSTGTITITDSASSANTLTIGAISIGNASNVGSLGAISVTAATGHVSTGAITLGGTANTGSIGTIALSGARDAALGAVMHSATVSNGGSIGNVSVTAGRDASTGAVTLSGGGNIGNFDLTAGEDVTSGAISHAVAGGSVGYVKLTGGGTDADIATLGAITLSTGTGGTTLGDITIGNAEDVNLGAVTAKTIGAISVTAVTAGSAPAATIDTSAISADNGTNSATIGAITLNAGTAGAVTIGGNITTNNTASNGTASIGAINITGATISVANNIQSASIGAITHNGATTFTADKGYQALAGLPSFTANGDTTFNSATTPNLRFGGTAGPALTFNGTTTFTGGGSPGILASNGGAALDRIASMNFNGKVVGVADKIAVRASQIGDISITSALATDEELVTNFSVYAGNNGATAGGSAETVARDGTGLSSNYTIGNISVQSTNTIGIAGTALFSGNNAFNAIGRIGNLSIQAGGSAAVQSELFQDGTDRLVVQVGNGNIATNNAPVLASGIDFDGNGTVGTIGATADGFGTSITAGQETGTDFSANVTVSIGNVTVNAAGSTTPGTGGSITGIGGAAATTNGFAVLSGVRSDGTNFDATTLTAIDTVAGQTIRGTVGNVVLTNLSQQLQVNGPYASTGALTTPNLAAVIAAASATAGGSGTTTTPFGTINGVATTALDTTGELYLVGGTDTTADANEIIVIRL